MDPDSTACAEDCLTNISQNKPNTASNVINDDFLTEFFPELKGGNSVSVASQNSAILQLEVDHLSNSLHSRESNFKQSGNMMNGHASIIDELAATNEKMKQVNKELKEKSITQESQIAKYEDELAEKMKELLVIKLELDTFKDKCETIEKENSDMTEKVTHLEAQVYQLKELKMIKTGEDKEISELQKDLSQKEKIHRKLKSDLESSAQVLAERQSHLKKMKFSNRRLWNLIAELGDSLSKAGLLTLKQKKLILKELAENTSAPETESEGESSDSSKTFWNRLTTISDVKSFNNSEENTISDPPENNDSTLHPEYPRNSDKEFETSTLIKPSEIEASQDNVICSSTPITKMTVSSGSSSKVKSFGSNYFLKSTREVLEDPHVSNDCLDVTLNELKDLRQQLSMRSDPISPLPQTPPPKNSKSRMQGQILNSPVASGKKLNFCHQQSESFDVQNDQPLSNSNFLTDSGIDENVLQKQLSQPGDGKYMLSTKRNHDGSLKLNFSANLDTHLSLDINTLQISCIVMPGEESHSFSNLTHPQHETLSRPVPTTLITPSQERIRYSSSITTGEVPCLETERAVSVPKVQQLCSAYESGSQAQDEMTPKKLKLNCSSALSVSPKRNDAAQVSTNTSVEGHRLFQCNILEDTTQPSSTKEIEYSNSSSETRSAFSAPSGGKRWELHHQSSVVASPTHSIADVNEKGIAHSRTIDEERPTDSVFKTPSMQYVSSSSLNRKTCTQGKQRKRHKHLKGDNMNRSIKTELTPNDIVKVKRNRRAVKREDPVSEECLTGEKLDNNALNLAKAAKIWAEKRKGSAEITVDEPNRLDSAAECGSSKSLSPVKTLPKLESSCVVSVEANTDYFSPRSPELPSEASDLDFKKETILPDVEEVYSSVSRGYLATSFKKEGPSTSISPSENVRSEDRKAEVNSMTDDLNNITNGHCRQVKAELCKGSSPVADIESPTDEMDFSGISLDPFNPSTFTTVGLFTHSSPSKSDSHLKINFSPNKTVASISVMNQNTTVLPTKSSPHSAGKETGTLKNGYIEDNISNEQSSLASPANRDSVLGATNASKAYRPCSKGKRKPHTNGVVDSASSLTLDSDGLDSEHSLVIAESIGDAEPSGAHSDIEEEDESDSPKKPVGKIHKKRKRKNLTVMKNQNKKYAKCKSATNDSDQVSIEAAFKNLEQMKFTDMHSKHNQHTLLNALINPSNAKDTKEVVYHILKHVCCSRANPMMTYFLNSDPSILLPLAEDCIVTVICHIGARKRQRLQGFLESLVITAYELVLVKQLTIYNLSALCRVMTEVSKRQGNRNRPLMLCCELLKLQHKYAPYLIASIASVWKELFDVSNVSDEEMIFHSSIAYGLQKKPTTLTDAQWKHCNLILSTYLTAPALTKVNETAHVLIHAIETKCFEGTIEDEYMLTLPLVIFTVTEGWDWAKDNLINPHILPFMVRFAEKEHNPQAFKLFCNLYVDICNFCPDEEEMHEVLMDFLQKENEGDSFRKDVVLTAQLRILLHKRGDVFPHLSKWIEEIQHDPERSKAVEVILVRRCIAEGEVLSENDIRY